MPRRMLDFEALWASDKLAACAAWAQAEYAWLYGLADAWGCFELSNLRVIWGRVAAIRKNLSPERLEQVFNEFQVKGLLFIWEDGGKRYGFWTNSDRAGRLPPKSERTRYARSTPPVPEERLAAYVSSFLTSVSEPDRPEPQPVLEPIATNSRRTHDQVRFEEGLRREGKGSAPQSGARMVQAEPRPSPFAFSGLHLKVSTQQDQLLGEAFPWVDRQAEYRKADSWCEANPNRRPRRPGRFLHNWFSKIEAPSTKPNGGGSRAQQRTRNNLAAAGFVQ